MKSFILSILLSVALCSNAIEITFHINNYREGTFILLRVADSLENIFQTEFSETDTIPVFRTEIKDFEKSFYTISLMSNDMQKQSNYSLYLDNNSKNIVSIDQAGNLTLSSTDKFTEECHKDMLAMEDDYEITNVVSFIRKYKCHDVAYLTAELFVEILYDNYQEILIGLSNPCNNISSIIQNAFINKYESFKKMKTESLFKNHFTVNDIKGETIESSYFIDTTKETILYIWASWCSPCIQTLKKIENKDFTNIENNYNLIFISIDKDFSKWAKFSIKYLMNNKLSSYIVPLDKMDEFIKVFNAQQIPQTLVFDKYGNLTNNLKNLSEFISID